VLITLILNDPPYGNEKNFNALRLALHLKKKEGVTLRVFLTGDAVGCALKGQATPEGWYNLGRMLAAIARNSEVRTCITCQQARGLKEEDFIEGVKSGSTVQLADWVAESDKVISY
jgi:uncharacterized protein involved in oxidation of intracellular sulfur